jgi:hypothetical protein
MNFAEKNGLNFMQKKDGKILATMFSLSQELVYNTFYNHEISSTTFSQS